METAAAPVRKGGWGALASAWAKQEEQQAPVYRAALERLSLAPGQEVLDLGCGAGVFLRHAAAWGLRVAGFYASPELLEQAGVRVPGADLRLGDLERLPFADRSFDVVTAFNSLFFAADMTAALREARRVAKPGAPILVQVWGRPERCDLSPVLRALGRLASGPATGAQAPSRLWAPGVLDGLAEDAGLVPGSSFAITAPMAYPDEEALLRGLLSAGGAVEAVRTSGEEAVRAAVLAATAPHRRRRLSAGERVSLVRRPRSRSGHAARKRVSDLDAVATPRLELLLATLAHFDAALLGASALSRALAGATIARDWERFPEALPALREQLASGEPANATWGTYLFVLREPRTLVGWGGFKGPPTKGEVELGYSVAPDFEGQGIATTAVRELLRTAAEGQDVAAVTAQTLAGPGPSPRVLQKAGFAKEARPKNEPGQPVWRWRKARPLLT